MKENMRTEYNLYVISEKNNEVKDLIKSFGDSLKYIFSVGNRKYNTSERFNYRQYSHYNAYIAKYHEVSKGYNVECKYLNNTPDEFFKLMMNTSDYKLDLLDDAISEMLILIKNVYKLPYVWCEVALFEDAYINFDDYEEFKKELYSKYQEDEIRIAYEK